MKIIDISRDIFKTKPYPGDPFPEYKWIANTEDGDDYNISYISMCSHIATHIDAPKHIDGKDTSAINLNKCYGDCTVISIEPNFNIEHFENIISSCKERILLHGNGKIFLNSKCAEILVRHNIKLIGTDANSIGDGNDEYNVHKILLSNEIIILEGLELNYVNDGDYILSALPLKMSNIEASPVRAVLIDKGNDN